MLGALLDSPVALLVAVLTLVYSALYLSREK